MTGSAAPALIFIKPTMLAQKGSEPISAHFRQAAWIPAFRLRAAHRRTRNRRSSQRERRLCRGDKRRRASEAIRTLVRSFLRIAVRRTACFRTPVRESINRENEIAALDPRLRGDERKIARLPLSRG